MSRVIRKSRARSSREAAHLLAALFTAELAAPSRCLWLVSPWISDIPIVDNTSGSFDALSSFGPRAVRLAEVLVTLGEMGSMIVIGTTSDTSNDLFRRRVTRLFSDRAVGDQLTVAVDQSGELHEKAITGDDYVVTGSMNLTNNGVFIREEYLEFRVDDEFVARSRMDAHERFGGLL